MYTSTFFAAGVIALRALFQLNPSKKVRDDRKIKEESIHAALHVHQKPRVEAEENIPMLVF